MIRSKTFDLLGALGIQFLFAGLSVLATWQVFGRFGAAFFVEYSSISAVFLIVNYFDFGAIGVARRIGAQADLPIPTRHSQVRTCLLAILLKLGLVPAAVAILLLASLAGGIREVGGIDYLRSILVAAAVSPVFVGFGILRGYLEGAGRLGLATLLRGGNGLLIAAAPLISDAAWGDPHTFFVLPPIAVGIFVVGFLVVARRRYAAREDVPTEFRIVGQVELVYTLAGVLFLYLDRYVIGLLGRDTQGGGYLLALEMAARASLLFVPIVMNTFPEMVRRSEADPAGALRHVGSAALKAASAVASVFLLANVALWLFSAWLPVGMRDPGFARCFAILSLAYVATAGIFAYQKFVGVNSRQTGEVVKGYGVLSLVDALLVVLVTWKFGPTALALLFLGRSLAELALLRALSERLVFRVAVP